MSSPTENTNGTSSKKPKSSRPPSIQVGQPSINSQADPDPSQDTPRTGRYPIYADQAKMKTKIADDMRREIFETDWELFKQQYMSFFPTENKLDTYLNAIAACRPKILQPDGSGYRFLDHFNDVDEHEDIFFKPLQAICKKITNVVARAERPSPKIGFELVLKPKNRNQSSIDGATHKMDGYFRSTAVKEREYSDHHINVAVCAEFKKKSNGLADVVKNRRQLVSDANFSMNNDPRRMFTFGFTIEGGDCCVWYFSRSHSAKSKSFKWKGADLRQFIGMIIAFTFAEPEQLGYDPTITLIRNPKECFVFRIDEEFPNGDNTVKQSRYFQTVETISELHTTCITGRATRVWTAVEVKDAKGTVIANAPTVVLKDVWLDENAQTERCIQQQIFDDIDAFKKKIHPDSPPPEFKNLKKSFRERVTKLLDEDCYRDYFLTIITDSVSHPCKPALHLDGKSEPNPDLLHEPNPQPPVKASASTADPTRGKSHPSSRMDSKQILVEKQQAVSRMFISKKRYRVVFEEVCSAIHCRTSFSEVMTAMQGALFAIFLLFAAGWVHRDISTGNILWYKPSGKASRGILSDLEYAKRYPQDAGSADPKTGTPYFMPTEILRGLSWYQDPELADALLDDDSSDDDDSYEDSPDNVSPDNVPPDNVSSSSEGDSEDALGKEAPALNNSSVEKEPPVKHNFLHDMESFFWVFFFIICTALPAPKTELINIARLIFNDTFRVSACQNAREGILRGPKQLYIKNKVLAFLDPSLSTIAHPVTQMVINFNLLYTHVPVDCEDYKSTISIIFKYAMKMINCAKKANAPAICFKPLLELGKSEKEQKQETDTTTLALVSQDRLSKKKADRTSAQVSQGSRLKKGKAVDHSVQNDTSAPPQRSRNRKEVEPSTRRLRSQSQKGSDNAIPQTKSQSGSRSKPSGSRKPRATRRKSSD